MYIIIIYSGRPWLVSSVMEMTAPMSSSPEFTRVSPPSCPGYSPMHLDPSTAIVMVKKTIFKIQIDSNIPFKSVNELQLWAEPQYLDRLHSEI